MAILTITASMMPIIWDRMGAGILLSAVAIICPHTAIPPLMLHCTNMKMRAAIHLPLPSMTAPVGPVMILMGLKAPMAKATTQIPQVLKMIASGYRLKQQIRGMRLSVLPETSLMMTTMMIVVME